VLIKPAAERTVSAQLTGAKTTFSTADAKKLGIKRVTGKFTTYFPYLPYRNINIGRAAALINGTVLKPGDVFSLNKIVGERTVANVSPRGSSSRAADSEGTWRRRPAKCHNHVQRHVLCRTQGRLPQAARFVYRPLPGRSRGNGGMAWCLTSSSKTTPSTAYWCRPTS
jgi:hypothetical protein